MSAISAMFGTMKGFLLMPLPLPSMPSGGQSEGSIMMRYSDCMTLKGRGRKNLDTRYMQSNSHNQKSEGLIGAGRG